VKSSPGPAPAGPGRRPFLVPVLRLGVSAALLAGLLHALDAGAILGRLGRMDPAWAAAALGLSVTQVALLAWRWRFTARRLGIPLSYRTALEEYYLGVLLNQLLPGGVLGDVSRAWRHARGSDPGTPASRAPGAATAVRGVILERASAQVVMTAVALASTVLLLLAPAGGAPLLLGSGIALIFTLGGAGLLLRGLRPLPARDSLAGRIWSDAREAVLAPGALAVQLFTGALAVGTYIAVFLAAARAVGVGTPLPLLLPLVAPILMTMLIPVSIAGWGLREGAAAALWGAVGLSVTDGVLTSMAYGVLVLVSSLPGTVILLRSRQS
jgi:glycosyltransferase 2 family protein